MRIATSPPLKVLLALLFLASADAGVCSVVVTKEFGRVWPNKRIPYWIQPTLIASEPKLFSAIKTAIAEWNALGLPVSLVALNGPTGDHVQFAAKSATNCTQLLSPGSAPPGYFANKGVHRVCLDPGQATKGTILHELGHVAGLFHEHQHCKRDEYILVDFTAIQAEKKLPEVMLKSNYAVVRCENWMNPASEKSELPYDFGSIMHYSLSGRMDYGPIVGRARHYSLTPRGYVELRSLGLSEREIGQRDHLSAADIAALKNLYSP